MTTYIKSLQKHKLYFIGIVLFIIGLILSLLIGNRSIGTKELVYALLHPQTSSTAHLIFYSLRLPRALAALLCGMALSISGLLLQSTLHNDLAAPGILGINAGAGFFALIAGLLIPGSLLMKGLFSFAGALAAVVIVLLLSLKVGSSQSSIILIGVAVSAVMNAGSQVIVTFIPESLADKTAFSLGGFHIVSMQQVIFAALTILPVLLVCYYMNRGIAMLALGDETAYGLGLDPRKMRIISLICAALLAGAAVSICGLLGFVGLMIPNAIRILGCRDLRTQMNLCGLYGGACLLICDSLMRLIFYPYELPVGLCMSILGAPFFIFLLSRRHKRGRS